METVVNGKHYTHFEPLLLTGDAISGVISVATLVDRQPSQGR